MTNKEKYKQAFSVLQTSDDFKKEMENMVILQRKHKMNMAIAAAIICLIFVGGTSTAYAANIGGDSKSGTALDSWRSDGCNFGDKR